jgi:hypothetical protein
MSEIDPTVYHPQESKSWFGADATQAEKKRKILSLGGRGEDASAVGNALSRAESNYFNALSGGDEADIAKCKLQYEKAQTIFQAFMQFTSNAYEIMMGVIRKMDVR